MPPRVPPAAACPPLGTACRGFLRVRVGCGNALIPQEPVVPPHPNPRLRLQHTETACGGDEHPSRTEKHTVDEQGGTTIAPTCSVAAAEVPIPPRSVPPSFSPRPFRVVVLPFAQGVLL